eukprot:TRINITY_DN11585_c0_g1_i2.p1 TRINITY_DN11585_c0_g1~~TRINITY_DN11585_c0_g1_i2.p1  ORF type:complete len:335 (+),score=142.05 TRINITY_DN11585_c0_g1_i2:38-1006(+)
MSGISLAALRGDLAMPSTWQEVGEVAKLYIYPIKSLANVEVEEFIVKPNGAQYNMMIDRQFMVVDKKGKMITARRYPHMSMVVPMVTQAQLVLTYPGMDDMRVEIPRNEAAGAACEVWGEECMGVDMGDSVGEWLSDIILQDPQGGLRLVFHNKEESSRPDKEGSEYLTPLEKAGDKPLYADGYPYLLLASSSIKELNRVLEEDGADLSVEETRFRPNIYIEGDFPAFAEDKWTYVKIGDCVFRNVKLCTRCVYTTVDPDTGEKNHRGEPLKTLRSFRTSLDKEERKAYGTSPFFGVNLGVEVMGEIRVGDKVMISSTAKVM